MIDPVFESLKDLPYENEWDSLERIASWGDFKGFRGRTHTEETKKKMSEAHKGHTFSEETRAKLSAANKGKPRTASQLEALREMNSRPRSKQSNAKRSQALKGKVLPKVTCPHCGAQGSAGNIARWHGVNCKEYT